MTRSVRRRPAVIAFAVALVALMLGSSSPASAGGFGSSRTGSAR